MMAFCISIVRRSTSFGSSGYDLSRVGSYDMQAAVELVVEGLA